MAPPRKTVADYEVAATRTETGCLIVPHRSAGAVARRVYIMRHGPLTTKQYVCHTCDTPACIEDSHHFIGTCGDNVRDAVAKGRHSCFHPSVRGAVKFKRPRTQDERDRISAGLRAAYAEGRKGPSKMPPEVRRAAGAKVTATYLAKHGAYKTTEAHRAAVKRYRERLKNGY